MAQFSMQETAAVGSKPFPQRDGHLFQVVEQAVS